MSVFFFDTSAVVKRYIPEPGTTWIRSLCDKGDFNSIFISEIAVVEGAAAFALLARRGIISKRESQDAYERFLDDTERQYRMIGLTSTLVRAAAELTQHHPLKAYDAIQLAFGLHLNTLFHANNQSLIFVTADETLLQAARAEGIATENPFDHRDLDTTQ
ncbi:MAG: type II toxin-antitoxin system VapC family toxin [candidate division KSB1 bacterium]|nr:type II toxin-antitoxin system VapC family toxin [candidate division KSB1 bacterium]